MSGTWLVLKEWTIIMLLSKPGHFSPPGVSSGPSVPITLDVTSVPSSALLFLAWEHLQGGDVKVWQRVGAQYCC